MCAKYLIDGHMIMEFMFWLRSILIVVACFAYLLIVSDLIVTAYEK